MLTCASRGYTIRQRYFAFVGKKAEYWKQEVQILSFCQVQWCILLCLTENKDMYITLLLMSQ